jgi:predicted helicase
MHAADVLKTCPSWEDFQHRLASLSDKEKGDAFEMLVSFALELHPLYATKLEKVWHHSAVPFEVREHLGIPLKDYGIDIVARTFEGDYWAVQAKYRSERDGSLTHEELATFMSLTFGVSARFAYGLVCTTTDRVTHLLEANARVGFCKADFWSGLDEEFFARLNARLAGRRQIPRAKTPRRDQRDAVAAAVLHYVDAGESRGKFISPCGSGKTLTAWWIAGALNAHRIIIAVPSLFLISQTLSVWLREALAAGLSVNWLCVCSDDSAGKAERDELVTYVHDLGIPCVTDPARIMAEMRKMNAAREIILTTYQSSPSFAEAAKTLGWPCDLAVFDEAHKTVSTRRSRFTHLLFDDHLPIARRLFMTATERRFKGTTDEVVSMDDPKLYGATFHLLSFKAALESNPPVLCDYEVLTIGIRDAEVRKLIEERRFITSSRGEFDAMTANAFASLIALRRAVEKFSVAHAVSFHTSIRRAEDFQRLSQEFNQAFPEQPAVRSFHIAGTMPSTERDSILRNFATRTPSLVTNARCLTEGVDVPGIDCVMFVDPKASTVDIVQAAGRAMRLAGGKTKAYIVLPFVVRDGASIDDAAKSADFGFVVAVLRALASQDERIIDELRAIQRGQPRRGGRVLNFDMGAIVPAEIEADTFVQAIELQCWGKLRRLTYMPYEEAVVLVGRLGVRSQKQFRASR